jgi:outer membrane protein assembly factor BamE (lipoprotein component of BamABCDE complex)
MKILVLLLAALLAAACASYGGASLRPGASSEAEVLQVMGAPAMRFTDNDGSKVLVYPRGPLGTQTFMVRLDARGVVRSIDPVLGDDTFNAIQPGLTTDDVVRMIGPPRETMTFERLGHEAWDYKYVDTWGYPAIFSVTFDRDGRVVSKISQRLERTRPF